MCHSPKRIGPPCCRSMDHLSVRLSMTGSPLGVNGGAGVGVVVVSDACTPDSMETKHGQALLVERDLHMEEPTAARANRPPVTKVSALADQTPNRRPGKIRHLPGRGALEGGSNSPVAIKQIRALSQPGGADPRDRRSRPRSRKDSAATGG